MRLREIEWTAQARRAYRLLSDRLNREIISALQDILADGLAPTAEELERELQNRYRFKVDGYRVIMMVRDDKLIIIDIRRRNRLTYLNIPIL